MIDTVLNWIIILILIGVVPLFAWIFYGVWRQKQALRLEAGRLGFTFQTTDPDILNEPFMKFPVFRDVTCRSVMRGDFDRTPTIISTGIYRFGSRYDATAQTVVCHRFANANLPQFELRPEHLGDKIASLVGYQDIDFKSHPNFSKDFHLYGKEEDSVRRLFTGDLLSYLETRKDWTIAGGGEWLVLFKAQQTCSPEDYRAFMDATLGIARQFEAKP